MPTEPPSLRMRLKRDVATPIFSGAMRDTHTVPMGTNRRPSPRPWKSHAATR